MTTSERHPASSTGLEPGAVDWLPASDPAIRWQTMRDLTGAPSDQAAAERARIETEGWCACLLSLRGADGLWAGSACFPQKVVDDWKAGTEPCINCRVVPHDDLRGRGSARRRALRWRLPVSDADAVQLVRDKQQPDGRWLPDRTHGGETYSPRVISSGATEPVGLA